MNLAPRFTQDAPTYGGGVGEGSHVRVQRLHSGSPAVREERTEGGLHPLWERTGCHWPPLPGYWTHSRTGLIDSWSTKLYSAQLYTVLLTMIIRKNVNREHAKQQGADHSDFPKSAEILKERYQLNIYWARGWQGLQSPLHRPGDSHFSLWATERQGSR